MIGHSNFQPSLGACAFGDDEGDVVVLLVGAEALDLFDDGCEGLAGSPCFVLSQGCDKALLTELFSRRVEGFGYAVGVERQRVPSGDLAFLDRRVPFFEQTEHCGSRVEALDLAVAAEEDGTEVAAVGVAESAGGVVVVGEEDGGVGGVGGVLEEEAVDGLQEELRLVARECELTAEVGLKIRHQKSGGDAFAGDVADDKAESLMAEGEEVVVVAADVAGLDADAGVVKGFEGR